MFNWLGNLFPYSDLHSLNLDWLLSKMKETATQAAKAVADAANALAQIAEAKAAALSAQTAAQDAQTAANKAAGNAASAAANATAAINAANSATTAAQNAQNTANAAQIAAQNAQNTANEANTAAENANNTADEANTAANEAKTSASELSSKFPIKREDITDKAIDSSKIDDGAIDRIKIAPGAVTANEIATNAVVSEKIAESAVTSGKISNDVMFGFQYDNSSSYASINSTATPLSLRAPSFPGRRAAYLNFSSTVSGYRFITANNLLSLNFNESVVYMFALEIMNETTMEITKYIVKYANNTITLYTPGTTESQNTVIPLNADVSTYKIVKTT